MAKKKEYWYILHIPTGNIVKYRDKCQTWVYTDDSYSQIAQYSVVSLDVSSFGLPNMYNSQLKVPNDFYKSMVHRQAISGELHFKTKVDARDFLRDFILSKLVKDAVRRDLRYVNMSTAYPKDAEFIILSSTT